MVTTERNITQRFGEHLAQLLASKISTVYPAFQSETYIQLIAEKCVGLKYSQRVVLHADLLQQHLPPSYPQAREILAHILGEENPHQTGMFTRYYWILPLGKFVETYGIDHLHLSLDAIEEITKRNTGEYAIRAFIRKYPSETMQRMHTWSTSPNFHLRRLASEGCRPKLPRATKLDLFIDNPTPVFDILYNLQADEVKFVQKSVANNIRDYLKVNQKAAMEFIQSIAHTDNPHTQRIIKHATRNMYI